MKRLSTGKPAQQGDFRRLLQNKGQAVQRRLAEDLGDGVKPDVPGVQQGVMRS